MIGPIPVASIGSGSRSASSSVLVSTIIIIALSHLVGAIRLGVLLERSRSLSSSSSVLVVRDRSISSCYYWSKWLPQ